jgi:hypothetical protein
MAYANRYILGSIPVFPGVVGNVQFYAYIQEKDYTGSAEYLNARFDSYQLNRDFDSLDQHVLGMNFEFTIVNEKTDWFTLFDLMTATEKKYKLIVDVYENKVKQVTLFEGFINVEITEQKYLHKQDIRLVASSYLNKLQYFSPASLDTIGNKSFIDIISEILNEIGLSSTKIRINCSLIPSEDYGIQSISDGSPGYSLFDKCGFYAELFWKNEVERKSSEEILNSILLTFNCYLYWWDGYWYIEHYNNIWSSTSKYFVEYTIGNSYDPFHIGIWRGPQVVTTKQLHDLVFTEMTQTMYTLPGFKQIIIKLNEQKFYNLVPTILANMIETSDAYPDIEQRQWYRYHEIAGILDWDGSGEAYRDIEHSIHAMVSDVATFSGTTTSRHKGLYINFPVTVTDGTSLTIKWKYCTGDTWVYGDRPEIILFDHWWTLRFVSIEGGNDADVFLSYNRDNPEPSQWYLYNGYYSELLIQNSQADFDPDSHTVQLSVTVPLSEINKYNNTAYPISPAPLRGTYMVQLTIGPVWRKTNQWYVLEDSWFGDVEVSVSGNELPNNYIEGSINTDFLDKKEINVDLADVADFSFANGIVRGGTSFYPLTERTILWRSKISGDTASPVIDRLLQDNFRFYNVTREKIQGNVLSVQYLRPLSQFTDAKQSDKKFVLFGYSYKPTTQLYDMTLLEYDNETSVTLTDI